MILEIARAGGRIDRVFFSPDVESPDLHDLPHDNVSRKPGIKMALQAKKEFPEIDFKKSIMVGDSYSDMLFGKRLGMKNVLIGENYTENSEINELVSYKYISLKEFADDL